MPKTKLQNIIFTLVMAFVMVYAMVCYNVALDKGIMSNEVFLIAFHEIPIMCPVMSLIATILFMHPGKEIVALWLMKWAQNFPMALCFQIFFAGPAVRNLFGLLAKKAEKH